MPTHLNKKILVIGGSGFIGHTLIPTLLSKGFSVTIMNRGNKPMDGTKQLIADRKNLKEVQKAADSEEKFDVVIDTCSYNGSDTQIAWSCFSAKTEHWIHLSSAAVYKETPGRFPAENDEIGGAKIWEGYGVEKSEADQFLIEHSKEIPVTIFRPPYLYGPGNDNDRETFIWSRSLRDRPVIIPGDGITQIQFLHVEDLSNAFIKAIENKPDKIAIYNIGANERPTFSEWVAEIARIANKPNPGVVAGSHAENYKPRQYFPFRNYPCCVEVNLLKKELEWEAKYSIEEGFKQTFDTYDYNALINREIDTDVEDIILAKITNKKES